jgi:hypothetical protein
MESNPTMRSDAPESPAPDPERSPRAVEVPRHPPGVALISGDLQLIYSFGDLAGLPVRDSIGQRIIDLPPEGREKISGLLNAPPGSWRQLQYEQGDGTSVMLTILPAHHLKGAPARFFLIVEQKHDATLESASAQEEWAHYMRELLEDHQNTTEELQAALEELRRANEALQETRGDREAVTRAVLAENALLQKGQRQLLDMLESAHLALVTLDFGLNILLFTAPAARLFCLQDADVGRHLNALQLQGADIEEACLNVIRTVKEMHLQVHSSRRGVLSLRIRPYVEKRQISGVLLDFRI